MTTKEQVLQNCTVHGTIIKLPDVQLDRKLYQEVAKALQLIGGKWKGGKVFGFVFPTNPTDLLTGLLNGDKITDLKKEYNYFDTPDSLCNSMVEAANIHSKELTILEPSAGQGSIIDAIIKKAPLNQIFYCEAMPTNQLILEKKYGQFDNLHFMHPLNDDFLELKAKCFDRIIANPPFSKNRDILHIKKMYDCLNIGGVLVTIASKHWTFASEKICKDFRKWLDEVNADITDIEAGTFKESGTMISTVLIQIKK